MGKKIKSIGRYVMEGVLLGKGNFARVELAVHEITGVKVAVKVIDTRKIKEEYIRQNLHREARIMAHLRHPNIIRLYETLKATTLYCLVTEYASGGELLTYIKSQEGSRLTESAARPFIRQLVSALNYIHARNVVHRDLKMENIMLDEKKKNIKIIDFGLSAVWKENEPLKTHCGSPEYAAPELFVVGKTYGHEVDIWSFGIITYAMTIGKLPFFTAFKDEYQRKRMLEQIQKGLSGYHDREMRILSADCRNLLHQLIEPNPELRIPLSEVEKHPWITRNGKNPFCPYKPPPRDKLLRHQTVGELAFMMGLKRNLVEETVKDNRADELSAMYNMMMDQKKKNKGLFDYDHTSKKVSRRDRESRSRSRERDKIHTPDSGGRGKDIKGKSGAVKKVPNKSTAGKAGAGSKAKPKNRYSSIASQEGRGIVGGADRGPPVMAREPPPALSSPTTHKPAVHTPLVTPLAEKPKDIPTINGPTRIPLSQRRHTPPKLNLTLDLSIAHNLPSASSNASKRPACLTSSVESAHRMQDKHKSSSKQGIEASSGVPPRLSPQNKDTMMPSPTKPTSLIDRLERHLPAPCRPSSFQHTLRSPWHKPVLPAQSPVPEISDNIGASSDKEDSLMQAEKLVAPKATPEDSLIDSYSTASEEDRNRLCQLLEEREDFYVEEGTLQVAMQTNMLNTVTKYGNDISELAKDHGQAKVRAEDRTPSQQEATKDVSEGSKDTLVRENVTEGEDVVATQLDPRQYLLRNFSLSEQYDSSGGSQYSQSSHSDTHFAVTGSGSSLPGDFHRRKQLIAERTERNNPRPEVPLAAAGLSDTAMVDDRLSSSAAAAAAATHRRNPSLMLSLDGSNKHLAPSAAGGQCRLCGISPESPTYFERHAKFCHTGAHALDVFFSPDEVPSPTGQLWRPVASTIQDSPTRASPERLTGSPLFGSPTAAAAVKARQVQLDMTMEGYTEDDEEDEDEDDVDTSHRRPLLPSSAHKCHSPTTHIPAVVDASSASSTTADMKSGKRTAPSKVKSKSANPSSKNKRLSKNGGYSAIPESSSSRLDPSGSRSTLTSSSSSSSSSSPSSSTSLIIQDTQVTSTEKLAATCNAAKIHPVEKPKGEGKSLKSRIPRPSANRFGRLQVLSILGSEKHKDKGHELPDSTENSPKSTPEKKSDKDHLLKQYDSKNKSYTWRQGLSHLLRIHRSTTNSNNNLTPSHKKANSVSRTTSNSKTNPFGNSIQSKGSSEHNSNHGTPNKTRRNSKEVFYQELDTKWTSPPSPVHKCNSLTISSSPVPSTQTPALFDIAKNIPECLQHAAKPRRAGWKGCKECAASDHSSDEGTEMATPLERKSSSSVKDSFVPSTNSIQKVAPHMTSKV